MDMDRSLYPLAAASVAQVCVQYQTVQESSPAPGRAGGDLAVEPTGSQIVQTRFPCTQAGKERVCRRKQGLSLSGSGSGLLGLDTQCELGPSTGDKETCPGQ